MNAQVPVLYLLCCMLWGSTWLVIKIGLLDLPPLHFAAARMALAAAVLLPFALRGGLLRLRAAQWARIGFVGLLQMGVSYALMFAGQQWVSSALAAVLFATFPVWLLLLARALLQGHPLRPGSVLAAALGLGGIVVLQLPALRGQGLGAQAALGGSLIVAAAVVAALANVLVRRWLSSEPPVLITFVQILSGTALLACAAALETGRAGSFTPRATLAVAYLAVFGTALTYLALFWLIPRLPIAAIGAIPLLDTTIAVCLGALVLHEHVGWPLFAGGTLVLTGAAIANFSGTARPPALPDSAEAQKSERPRAA